MATETPSCLDHVLARAVCRKPECDVQVVLVDAKQDKRTGKWLGGSWIHIKLPDTVHPAGPRKIK